MDVDQNIMNALKYPKESWGKVFMLGVIFVVPFILIALGVFLGIIIDSTGILALIFGILGFIIAIIAVLII